MTTRVEKSIMVNVPVSTAYNQWTQFEDFPQFMSGIQSVTQLSDHRLEWVAEIAGVKRKWEAKILEQVPDQKIAWAATEGATNAGEVRFEDLGGSQTSLTLVLEYEPEGLVEKVGDKLNVVENQAEGDLNRFKEFIESEGYASGAWRGTVAAGSQMGTPGVEDAAASRGDSGKAGLSGKAVAAGVGVAAAAAAVAASAGMGGSKDKESTPMVERTSDFGGTSDVGPMSESLPTTAGAFPPPVADERMDAPATTDFDTSTGTDSGQLRQLSDEEINAGASDVPLGESEPSDMNRDRPSAP